MVKISYKYLGIAGLVVVLIFLNLVLWQIGQLKQRVTQQTPVSSLAPSVSDSDIPSSPEIPTDESVPKSDTKIFEKFTENDILRGQVAWQEPENLGDLGWTSPDVYNAHYEGQDGYSAGMRYLRVGKIRSGIYQGADVILTASWFYRDEPRGNGPVINHYLRLLDKVVFLPYATAASGVEISTWVERSAKEVYGDTLLAITPPNLVTDTKTRFEELASYPNEIHGSNERVVLIKEQYGPDGFFSENGLKLVMTDSQLGQIWMWDAIQSHESIMELNSYQGRIYEPSGDYTIEKKYFDPLSKGGFYLRRPDGVVETYRLKFDIFDKSDRYGVLQATWNDGKRNSAEYEQYPGGCGLSSYAYDVTNDMDVKKDLIPIGKTDMEDVLYGAKDIATQDVKTLYENVRNGAASAKVNNMKEFLALNPVVFWVDPLGRVLEFYNTAIVPLAECGKPVVYLYPEETTDVSVRIFPGEGVSVSDPPYQEGWNVTAHPDGTLINQADKRTYDSLFWEGGSDVPYRMPEQGFVVSEDKLENFFNEKLKLLGLNEKEAADFSEYWIPKMRDDEKPYYFITFLTQRDIDLFAPLKIEPRPDTVIRIMMDYEGLDTKKSVREISFRTPVRKGFTVVEWGGRIKP